MFYAVFEHRPFIFSLANKCSNLFRSIAYYAFLLRRCCGVLVTRWHVEFVGVESRQFKAAVRRRKERQQQLNLYVVSCSSSSIYAGIDDNQPTYEDGVDLISCRSVAVLVATTVRLITCCACPRCPHTNQLLVAVVHSRMPPGNHLPNETFANDPRCQSLSE